MNFYYKLYLFIYSLINFAHVLWGAKISNPQTIPLLPKLFQECTIKWQLNPKMVARWCQSIGSLEHSPDYYYKAIKNIESIADVSHGSIGHDLQHHLKGKETGEYQVADLYGFCQLIRLCGESGGRRDQGGVD